MYIFRKYRKITYFILKSDIHVFMHVFYAILNQFRVFVVGVIFKELINIRPINLILSDYKFTCNYGKSPYVTEKKGKKWTMFHQKV